MNFLKNHSLILACITLLLFSSCSTRKNTFPNRAYHTVTSKFNVNFNAKEALKTGEAELEKKVADNYTQILPIYNYPAKTEIASIAPSMDRAIEKCSKSIYKHSMMIRGTEHVKTMDDVYLVMGKAYFHKQDYIQAQRIFNYIDNTYKGKKWNCRDEAMILGIRTSLRQGYYGRSLELMDVVQEALYKNNSKKLNVMFNAAGAEYHLTAPDGDILSAIDFIQETIKNRPKRNFKTRLYFILGQLYEERGNQGGAQECFKKVIQRTPEYVMEFNAHMHLATNYDGTEASRNEIMKNLNKMLLEKKNEDYRDQIYYAMYKIAHADENQEDEISYLKQSVATYANNDYQRTYSSITLADILFEEELYIDAQAYYDTALLTLPANYPNREKVISKSTVLRELVDNLNVITLQDSLQRIAKMSPQQRDAWVKNMIALYVEEERRLAQEEANRMLIMQSTAHMANVNTNNYSAGGKWYFYNQALITSGKTDFFRNWGNRKLEDNWRISNKQQLSMDDMAVLNDPSLAQENAEYDEDGNLIKGRETDPKKADYYTQDLPLTEGAMDTSNMMVATAMYNAAIIYLDLLNDYKRSCETFEKLIRRFPDDQYTLPALYMLYQNYTQMRDNRAEEPKNVILTKYADTDYAKLIADPDYYKKLNVLTEQLEEQYETAYDAYLRQQWQQVVQISNEAIPQCENGDLKSKFEYIRAVAIGQTDGEDSLKTSLRKIITHYPQSEVAELATIYLSMFAPEKEPPTVTINEDGDTVIAPKPIVDFQYLPKEMHYVIVIVDIAQLNVADVRLNVHNFNTTFFSLQKYNLNNFYINSKEQMITVAKFKDKEEAMDYYNMIIKNDLFTTDIKEEKITIYSISATNYTTYYTKPDLRASYGNFFKEHYLE